MALPKVIAEMLPLVVPADRLKKALAVIVVEPLAPKMTLFEFEKARVLLATERSMEPFEKPTLRAPKPLSVMLRASKLALVF